MQPPCSPPCLVPHLSGDQLTSQVLHNLHFNPQPCEVGSTAQALRGTVIPNSMPGLGPSQTPKA